ncbi:MAG TPA: ECF-type sigma factor [Bryobacteraceae bacterium]|jgi:RNA polymerase sigma factor (TIGR02999 family)|nr:ECF-type sigma factor [Bryobacteraceae bacterium]
MSAAPRDTGQIDAFYASLYSDLRRLAHQRLVRNETITLLNTTALVHESYLKFLAAGRLNISDRAEFLCYAARVMRSVIVDCVRRRRAERRGGDGTRVPLDSGTDESAVDFSGHARLAGCSPEDEIIGIDQALEELAKVDDRMVKVVEMRYFAGLDNDEIAAALGVTDRTVRRDWEKARLLLSVALQ